MDKMTQCKEHKLKVVSKMGLFQQKNLKMSKTSCLPQNSSLLSDSLKILKFSLWQTLLTHFHLCFQVVELESEQFLEV